MDEKFHDKLKRLINEYILLGYDKAGAFPRHELYGMISQVQRALVSIMLNYVEGFARTRKKLILSFYETAYGSLQESGYIFYLGCRLKYINPADYLELYNRKEEIAKMLWSTIAGLRKEVKDLD